MNAKRLRPIQPGESGPGEVLYWMSRDQRAFDNPALLFAQSHAREIKRPLLVVFTLAPAFLGATLRQYAFMLKGLAEVESTLAKKNIGFIVLPGDPAESLARFTRQIKPAAVFTDFDPLRIKREWKEKALPSITAPVFEVDAHNVVPCLVASNKQEFGARTIRPKIHRLLGEFLEEPPPLAQHPYPSAHPAGRTDWVKLAKGLKLDRSVGEVKGVVPGEKAAKKALQDFIARRLAGYDEGRNDPVLDVTSGLSPYLHLGQLAPLRAALEASRSEVSNKDRAAFIEQLVVRRELADNFCWFNPDYDRFAGFPGWARKTLDEHRDDPRPYLYSLSALENSETHDDLWNAAQSEMVISGRMHGWLRMYWAKKILEWSPSPEEALARAIHLNDKHQLDGRDPNGYTGIAWSLGGVHDRPWPRRPVFGTVRYMSYNGAKGKFDISAYLARVKKQGSAGAPP